MPRPTPGQRGLADRLGQRRVGVDGVGDVGQRQAALRRQGELVHELGDVGPTREAPSTTPAAGLADDAHEAVGLALDDRLGVAVEAHVRHLDLDALGRGPVLGEAAAGDLGVS